MEHNKSGSSTSCKRSIENFAEIERKAVRVIQYKGRGRTETLREQIGRKGYACGFEGLIEHIITLAPANEVIQQALRKSVPMYPPIAIRELVANALIHQDFTISGAGPMVEMFSDRIEVTSPGKPLVEVDRFLDNPPRSRNENIASLMRRFGMCEERGSGIDKVVSQCEQYHLPAPLFEESGENTRVVLFSHKSYADMTREDRLRACYLHACLRYVERDYLTNATLRERFDIEEGNRSMVSRLIREALGEGIIQEYDPSAGPKYRKYVPWWAIPARGGSL